MKAAKMEDKCAHMVVSSSSVNVAVTKINKMNTTILDSFTKLGNEVDIQRIHGGMALLNHLNQQNSDLEESREVKYALTRLIRGLGASKVFSRRGFYTTLTVYLAMHPETPIDKILSIMDSELKPMDSNPKSENGDIYTGQILLCGSLIRSKLLMNSTPTIQLKVIESLIDAGKQRSYLTFVSISFLIEYLNQIDTVSMKTIWPIIKREFGKDWSEQNLHIFYVLLFVKDKFPSFVNQKFMKKHLAHEELVSKDTMKNIVGLFTGMSSVIPHHPVVDLLCKSLTTVDLVTDFCAVLDEKFVKPSKHDEQLTMRILMSLLTNITDKSILPSLLPPNFLQHMIKKCSNCKKNNDVEILTAFREFLQQLVSATNEKDVKLKTQISVLKKLKLDPGDLMIERKTGIKVIQMITANLNADGVKKLSKVYKEIIENKVPKGKEDIKTGFWTNAERSYASQLLTRLLGHSTVIAEDEWRLEQLKFLFYYGLCEVSNVSVELAPQFKESFYRALDHKLPKLSDLRTLLSKLVHHIDAEITESNIKLRTPLSDDAIAAWNKVVQLIDKLEKRPKKGAAAPVFHTLNMHLGLQLFSDTEMALPSISDLQSCYERLTKKAKKRTKMVEGEEAEEEPEWIEVAVDLLLSLLSRNSHLLRSLVGCVFPHICPHLTLSAIYQILAVLDVNNDKCPLTSKDDSEDENSEMDCSDAEEGSDEEEEEKEDDAKSETASESESMFDESGQDEEETVTDRLRVAVSQALGDASMRSDDEEINVDDIGEEEGKLLDEKLAQAFRILRENRRGRSKKQQKVAQALTHFRVRVMDLLDAYLDSKPPMAIAIELIIPLFALLEFCIKDQHQGPLKSRVRTCLKKLSTVKKFKDTENVSDELLSTVIKALIEKGERSASVCQEMGDILAKCCTFLVRCVQQAGLSSEMLISVYKEQLKSFFKKRDCILSATLFKGVLQLCWEGNWELAPMLVDFAFDKTVRPFRRGQALEFLIIFYRNDRLLRSSETQINEKAAMEQKLYENTIEMFEQLSSIHREKTDSTEDGPNEAEKVKQKLICFLLTLLYIVHSQHLPEVWNWRKIAELLTEYRRRVSLAKDTKTAYGKLAKLIGAATNVKCEPAAARNGKADKDNEDNSVCEVLENGTAETDEVSDAKSKKKKKNKSKRKEKQLLKKQSRELRINAMSEGLGSFNFSSVNLYANRTDKSVENGQVDSDHDMEQSASKLQKRSLSSEPQQSFKKLKRKKSSETD